MFKDTVIIRGGGDIASGTINKLYKSGFKILVLEVPNPTSIRRKVCYSECIYDGEITLEDVTAVKVHSLAEIKNAWKRNLVPVIVDPLGEYVDKIKPNILVDAILAKKNLGTTIDMAEITIALGPGFTASQDVLAVIETMRGHNLGRIIFNGQAMKDTGVPGEIKGYSKERVIYSPAAGVIENIKDIGDFVTAGEPIAYVNGVPVNATISGLLRGIIRNGLKVKDHFKIADIDPRLYELKNCYTISDKARNIAGGVLEAILHLKNKKQNEKINENQKVG